MPKYPHIQSEEAIFLEKIGFNKITYSANNTYSINNHLNNQYVHLFSKKFVNPIKINNLDVIEIIINPVINYDLIVKKNNIKCIVEGPKYDSRFSTQGILTWEDLFNFALDDKQKDIVIMNMNLYKNLLNI